MDIPMYRISRMDVLRAAKSSSPRADWFDWSNCKSGAASGGDEATGLAAIRRWRAGRARLEVGSSRGASSGSHAAVSRGALRDTAASLCGQTHVRADPRCAARCMQREARDADLVPRGRAASARRLPQRRRCRASHCAHLIVPRLTAAALDRCGAASEPSHLAVALLSLVVPRCSRRGLRACGGDDALRRAPRAHARSSGRRGQAALRQRRQQQQCRRRRGAAREAAAATARPASPLEHSRARSNERRRQQAAGLQAAAAAAAAQAAPRASREAAAAEAARLAAPLERRPARARASGAGSRLQGCRAAGSSSSSGAGGAEGVARGGSG